MEGIMAATEGRAVNMTSQKSHSSRDGGGRKERGDKHSSGDQNKGEENNSKATDNSGPEPSTSDNSDTPLKKFFCPCCNIGHATSEDLINHIKEFPIKMETYSCNICMLEFFVKSDLIDHQRLDHQVTTHKTYKCDECDLDYSSLAQLNRHKNMHQDIANKLAACGIVLPKPKRDENPPKETPTGSVFPYRYSQNKTSTNNQTQKLSVTSTEDERVKEIVDEVTKVVEKEIEKAAPKPQPKVEEMTPAEELDPNPAEPKPEEKPDIESTIPTTRRKALKNSKETEENTSGFYIDLGTEVHAYDEDTDEEWQTFNSSDFDSNNERSDDPDFKAPQGKGRRRGRPRGSKNKVTKRPASPTSLPTPKRKYTRRKTRQTSEEKDEDEDMQEREEETDEKQEKRKPGRPRLKFRPNQEEVVVEEVEIPAHLRNEDGSIQCPDCDQICYSLRGLNRHRKYHFRTMSSMKCILCNKELTDKLQMNTHMRLYHPVKSIPPGGEKIRCSEGDCTAEFNSNACLSKHRIKVHGIEKSLLHSCETCGKVYNSSTELKNHKRAHTDERPFVCSVCNKGYRSSGGLLWHLKTHGESKHDILQKFENEIKMTDEGNYACEYCGKEFKSTYGIRLHRENPQKKCQATPGYSGKWKPKPMICEICGRECTSRNTLKSHMVTHTGERPHKCRYCEATFKHGKNKFIHEKMHRNQKDYICNVCGKAFYDGTNLKTHIASHKEIKDLPCSLCGKLFHVEINRRRHEKRCRNFIRCPICSAVFRQQERLMRHFMINHHGAQMPNADWVAAQPVPANESSTTNALKRSESLDPCSNASFVDSYALFADCQPPEDGHQVKLGPSEDSSQSHTAGLSHGHESRQSRGYEPGQLQTLEPLEPLEPGQISSHKAAHFNSMDSGSDSHKLAQLHTMESAAHSHKLGQMHSLDSGSHSNKLAQMHSLDSGAHSHKLSQMHSLEPSPISSFKREQLQSLDTGHISHKLEHPSMDSHQLHPMESNQIHGHRPGHMQSPEPGQIHSMDRGIHSLERGTHSLDRGHAHSLERGMHVLDSRQIHSPEPGQIYSRSHGYAHYYAPGPAHYQRAVLAHSREPGLAHSHGGGQGVSLERGSPTPMIKGHAF